MGDVTLVTLTEFGRRVEENGSGGTDHGFGQAVFLLGDGRPRRPGARHVARARPERPGRRRPGRDHGLPRPARGGAGGAMRGEVRRRREHLPRPLERASRRGAAARPPSPCASSTPRTEIDVGTSRTDRTGRPCERVDEEGGRDLAEPVLVQLEGREPRVRRRREAHLRDRADDQLAGHVDAVVARDREQLDRLPLVEAEDAVGATAPSRGRPPRRLGTRPGVAVESASTVCTSGSAPRSSHHAGRPARRPRRTTRTCGAP